MAFNLHLFHDTTFIIPLLLLIASQFNFFPSFFSCYIFSPPFFRIQQPATFPLSFLSYIIFYIRPSIVAPYLLISALIYLFHTHFLTQPLYIYLTLSSSPSLSLFLTLSLYFPLFSLSSPSLSPSISPSLFCPSYFVSVTHSLSGNDGEGS